MTLEDLLKGKDLAELSDEEIEEIISRLTPEAALEASKIIQKRAPKRVSEKAKDTVAALIAKGLAQGGGE